MIGDKESDEDCSIEDECEVCGFRDKFVGDCIGGTKV